MNALSAITTTPPVPLPIHVAYGVRMQLKTEFVSFGNFFATAGEVLYAAGFTRDETDSLIAKHALREESVIPLFPLRQAEARMNQGLAALAEDPTSRLFGSPFT